MPLTIPVLLGTAREGRTSDKAAVYVAHLLEERGAQSRMIDPRELLANIDHRKIFSDAWAPVIEKADALVIVTPEYTHGYPGTLKDVLDSAYKEYARKPVAICGCSAGGLGGARVVEQLREVVVELRMVPIREAVYFSNNTQLWNDDGSIKDPSYEKRVNVMLDELLWYAEVLKTGRETRMFPSTP